MLKKKNRRRRKNKKKKEESGKKKEKKKERVLREVVFGKVVGQCMGTTTKCIFVTKKFVTKSPFFRH